MKSTISRKQSYSTQAIHIKGNRQPVYHYYDMYIEYIHSLCIGSSG